MTKMAIILIYGKNILKFFTHVLTFVLNASDSGTGKPMSSKLGMQHRGHWLYLVYSNDDLWLTLADFTTRSIECCSGIQWTL